jgi:hypothetical protein
MTASQTNAETPVNIQNKLASSSACGPLGSSADCEPEHEHSSIVAVIPTATLNSHLMAASLRKG